MEPKPQSLQEQLRCIIANMIGGHLQFDESVQAFRKEFITSVLLAHKGNQCRAARQLGMHRNTLARTMSGLGIRCDRRKGVRFAA